MECIGFVIDFILHVDEYLGEIIKNFDIWTYIILFFVIFIETGVVIMPFLPGDSLIFAGAAFSAKGDLNIFVLYIITLLAAIIGDTVNYHIGKSIGKKLVNSNNRFIKKEYIEKTYSFFERHGGKSIIIARFVPIIRTFAPFVAGIGNMKYLKFLSFNVIGGFLWVSIFSIAGFFFGNITFIRDNFSIVILAIICISLLPIMIGVIKGKIEQKLPFLENDGKISYKGKSE